METTQLKKLILAARRSLIKLDSDQLICSEAVR